MEWTRGNRLATYSVIAIASVFLRSSGAAAQQVSELSVGIARIGTLPSATGASYVFGPVVHGAFGGVVAPRVRLSVDVLGVQFYRHEPFGHPCAFPGTDCAPIYEDQFSGLLGLSGAGRIDLDSRGRFYLTAGAGGYGLFLFHNSFRPGVSGGGGMAFPLSDRLVAVVEANWHEMLGGGGSPATLVPITVGLRF